MTRIFKNNFRFIANYYEEWIEGRCISQGCISTEIVAETYSYGIHFELEGTENLRILKSFDFEYEFSDVLEDRVQYVHQTSDFNPTIPIVCHLFHQDDSISYVRFAMTNPDRIIEFYGMMIELGHTVSSYNFPMYIIKGEISAKQMIKELENNGQLTIDSLMERAIKIFNNHSSIQTIDDVLITIENLKLFIKANEIDEKENNRPYSFWKPKILMYLSMCNYKINNMELAYCAAKRGLDAIDKIIEYSPITNLPLSMFGGDTLNTILKKIKEEEYIDERYENVYRTTNINVVETNRIEEMAGIIIDNTLI